MATQESGNNQEPIQGANDALEKSLSMEASGKEDAHSTSDRNDTPLSSRSSPDDDSDADSVGGQRNTMSRRRLMVAIPALSICLFVSFIDQTSVSTATPAIAGDLETGTATSWIGTSFLIASTAFQLINGRLSDIFGRKNLLLICLALMALGDLGCGFAQTPSQLFALRSVAGVGGGGINSLVMIIVSDITTLQNRGIYQGWLGAVIALANGVGPFLGGAIVEGATWRWVFWIIPIMTVPTAMVIMFLLPLKHQSGDHIEKMKKIDYGGVVLNIASTLLILVPLSGGGVTYAWSSPFFIAATVIGLVLAVMFVLYEWKLVTLPIMPLRLYKARHCWALYLQSFLTGLAYFGNFFYLPIYFQSILRYTPLVSGALILPVVITSSIASIACGQYMSRIGSYMHCILVGFTLWTLGSGLTLLFDRSRGLAPLIVILIVEGAGIGLTLQPVLVGMYANSNGSYRAVITGLRNFIRTIGGAFGLVISGVTLSNTLRTELSGETFATQELIAELTSSTYALDALDISQAQKERVLDVYMQGLHYVFIFFTVCAGISLLLTFWVGNTSLKVPKSVDEESRDSENVSEQEMREEAKQQSTRHTDAEDGNSSEGKTSV
ncbi:hypothetical protein CBER1_07689 [Cercospora berteroae]|uniref:Major facilitator superfamily (MFS) profile domain-containing protein n=1 Tax=Cercospora berteroae TaxID=357750 RepID=A0A2S6BT89_9PEZI|nr:hypothetical protein CBER1_07689 [Cercospora berteroae]